MLSFCAISSQRRNKSLDAVNNAWGARPQVLGLLQRLNCRVDKFICALRRADINQFRKPTRANRRLNLRNQLWKRCEIRNRGRAKSLGFSETFVN